MLRFVVNEKRKLVLEYIKARAGVDIRHIVPLRRGSYVCFEVYIYGRWAYFGEEHKLYQEALKWRSSDD